MCTLWLCRCVFHILCNYTHECSEYSKEKLCKILWLCILNCIAEYRLHLVGLVLLAIAMKHKSDIRRALPGIYKVLYYPHSTLLVGHAVIANFPLCSQGRSDVLDFLRITLYWVWFTCRWAHLMQYLIYAPEQVICASSWIASAK